MANTENIEAKLCAYVDGELDADGRAEIERHLVANPSHRRLLEELVRGRDLLRDLPRDDAPEDMVDEIQGHLERGVLLSGPVDDEAAAVAGRINRWPHRMAAAALVLLTVGLGAVIVYVLPHRQDGEFAVATSSPQNGGAPGGGVRLSTTDDAAAPSVADRDRATIDEAERRLPDAGLEAPRDAVAMKDAATAMPAPAAPSVAPAPDAFADNDATATDSAVAGAAPGLPAPSPTGTVIFSERFAKSGEADAPDVRAVQDRLFNADLARQLRLSPGGLKDNAMFVVVSTNDAAATKDQVTSYLVSNNIITPASIAWQPVTEPMPGPLDIADSQTAMLSRQNRTQVHMKGAPGPAGAAGGAGGMEPAEQQQQQNQQQQQESARGIQQELQQREAILAEEDGTRKEMAKAKATESAGPAMKPDDRAFAGAGAGNDVIANGRRRVRMARAAPAGATAGCARGGGPRRRGAGGAGAGRRSGPSRCVVAIRDSAAATSVCRTDATGRSAAGAGRGVLRPRRRRRVCRRAGADRRPRDDAAAGGRAAIDADEAAGRPAGGRVRGVARRRRAVRGQRRAVRRGRRRDGADEARPRGRRRAADHAPGRAGGGRSVHARARDVARHTAGARRDEGPRGRRRRRHHPAGRRADDAVRRRVRPGRSPAGRAGMGG